MVVPQRTKTPSVDADYWIQCTDDGSKTLVRHTDGVLFHSGCGAAAECDHVYIRNAGLSLDADVWPRRILEVGWGTGMAMLRTFDQFLAWRKVTPQLRPAPHEDSLTKHALHYVGLESRPQRPSVIADLDLHVGLADPALAASLLTWYASMGGQFGPAADRRSLRWDAADGVVAEIHITDAVAWLAQSDDTFDVIFFDPFDPATSPELWTPDVLADCFGCLAPGGRLVTYCIKSDVRRTMTAIGFHVQRAPGPPRGKREVLHATRPS